MSHKGFFGQNVDVDLLTSGGSPRIHVKWSDKETESYVHKNYISTFSGPTFLNIRKCAGAVVLKIELCRCYFSVSVSH